MSFANKVCPEGKKVKFAATTSVATPSDSAQTDMADEEYEKSFWLR